MCLGEGKRPIAFESKLEADFITLISSYPDVTSIEEQPISIFYQDKDRKSRRYTPDFLIKRYGAAPVLVEVKPSRFVNARLEPKLNAGRQHAASRGWAFEVWTEKEIKIPRLKNAQFFASFRNIQPNADFVA